MIGYLGKGAYLKTITTLQERRGDIDTTVFLFYVLGSFLKKTTG
jgi:hypothetical protein